MTRSLDLDRLAIRMIGRLLAGLVLIAAGICALDYGTGNDSLRSSSVQFLHRM